MELIAIYTGVTSRLYKAEKAWRMIYHNIKKINSKELESIDTLASKMLIKNGKERVLPQKDILVIESIDERITTFGLNKNIDEEINPALKHNQNPLMSKKYANVHAAVLIEYVDSKGNKTLRIVAPLSWHQRGSYKCLDRSGIRTFKTDRITRVRNLSFFGKNRFNQPYQIKLYKEESSYKLELSILLLNGKYAAIKEKIIELS